MSWLIQDLPEPSNEELGIVPYRGLPLLLAWCGILAADAALLYGVVMLLRGLR